MATECTHIDRIRMTSTRTHVCEDCIKTGDSWVHLRMCLECGHVGCCDSSKNTHATRHFHQTGHPLMRSIEPGEGWVWCYIDQAPVGDFDDLGEIAA
jgi:uncharacterized UBP type Zn finger protein